MPNDPLPDAPVRASVADGRDADERDDLYTVSVRALCEFAARRGDLDLRGGPSPTAIEGIAGHRTVAARRSPSHRSEVALTMVHGRLRVRGRADGFDPVRGVVEEIKTFRGDVARIPADRRALHRAQAEAYGWMLCARDGLPALDVAVVYYDVDRDIEWPPIVERRDAVALRERFEALCDAFVDWADVERAHRARRDRWLSSARFPHDDFRPGQRALAAAVWRAARARRCLVAEAPTGIGKTIGTVFPALRAMPDERIDRLFFVTARGTGRALALDALARVRAADPASALRVIELTALEKACVHPDRQCHGDACPLARGFHDRLPAARIAARDAVVLTQDALRAVAAAHDVCPYHLGVEMARWCDVVVGDYNHWFDGHPLLFALAADRGWRTVVLVDEAHNLVERAREMYSARLGSLDLAAVKAVGDAALRKPLARLTRAWNRLVAEVPPAADYAVRDGVSAPFIDALRDVVATIGERLADGHDGWPPHLLRFHFDALAVIRLAESLGGHSLFDVTVDRLDDGFGARSSIGVRNLIPAPHLAPRFAAAHATVLFSATLTPHAFYADTLGLPPDTARLDVPAPFSGDQLAVRIVRSISTRYRDRERSLAPIAELIARQFAARPGNYLVFVSSHDYLQRLAAAFAARSPTTACWLQTRSMDDGARRAFLDRFVVGGRGIGFAVLGGVFAEGIDLPGDRLIGAFVATLGLPRFDGINEAQRERLDARWGTGYEYAYLYPALRRVVQAAGRVIRSLADRGTLTLIDDRYARPEVLALLPAWWALAERDDGRSSPRPFEPPTTASTPPLAIAG